MSKLWLLEEYIGDWDKDPKTNFIGLYRSKKQAKQAKQMHLSEIDPDCITGYQLTRLDVKKSGFQLCYMTEDLGR